MRCFAFIVLFIIPLSVFTQEFNFTREYDVIPVSFDGVECQVPWTTGYVYINPTFCDIDGDDDQDLIKGSGWARLSYYRNIGSASNCSLEFVTDSLVPPPPLFAPLSQRPSIPALCDIDNDGDFDLFYSVWLDEPIWYGKLYFYENIGTSNDPAFYFNDSIYQGIESPADMYPFFTDIDNDDDYDLFIGFGYMSPSVAGRMALYINEGTPDSAVMVLESSQFMGIDLGYYCIPAFCDIDNDGDYDMFLGDEDGMIHYYRNDGSPEEYDFTEVTSSYAGVDVVNIASPEFVDIDDDGDFDLFVGERSWGSDDRRGGINYYKNIGAPDSAVFELVTQNFLTIDIGLKNHPVFADINDDNLLDMFIGDIDGNINYFSNTGTEHNPYFTFMTESFEGISANSQSRPCFGDLDDDGDLDMLAGRTSYIWGSVHYYQNRGTSTEPDYILVNNEFLGIECEWPSPKLIDIDNDGDLDLFVGNQDNQAEYWENTGTPSEMNFSFGTDNYFNTAWINNDPFIFSFGDLDNDGDYDMVRGHADDDITPINAYLDFYRNIGDAYNPNFILEEEHFLDISLVKYAEPFLADIDTDGDLDLFVGDTNGGVSFWRNNEINSVNREPSTVNRSFALLPNYPNPFNSSTTIPFTLDQKLPVRVVVYNQLGQNIFTLFDGMMDSGKHQVNWDAGSVSSGVYLVRLVAGYHSYQMNKIMLLK
jgi:hypothetical protein